MTPAVPHFHRRFATLAACCVALLVAAGCGPVPLDKTQVAALEAIRVEYAEVVREIRDRPDEDWHSGWMGNLWVNWRDGPARGLCFHWQEAVYLGVAKSVTDAGWERTGIQMNRGNRHEHHAVLVFDPALIRADEILEREPPRPVYVLDAWRRGRADVYMLDDWVKGSGWAKVESVEMEDLEAEAAEKAVRAAESEAAGMRRRSTEGEPSAAPTDDVQDGNSPSHPSP